MRNPWDRVHSAYLGKRGTHHFRKVREFYNMSNRGIPTFAQFVRFIRTQDPSQMDRHWRPFHARCATGVGQRGIGAAPWDMVGRLEDGLDEYIREALWRMGARIDLPEEALQKNIKNITLRINRSKYPAGKSHSWAYLEHGSRELVDIVGEVYRMDIERFGYTFD